MASHIYIGLGRWAEASDVNEAAVEADKAYDDAHGARGMYRISYMPHNSYFLVFSTSMEGRGQRCLEAATITRDYVLMDLLRGPGFGSQSQFYSLPYYAMVRFGMWDKILAEPAPEQGLGYPTVVWHFARGMAHARTGNAEQARAELATLRRLTSDAQIKRMDVWSLNTRRKVMEIARNVLAAEIAAAEKDYEKATALLREAVKIEATFGYHEPPVWYAPVRHTLGAVLLEAGRAVDAEQVYRDDLQRHPNNGWSLFGLQQALTAQGKSAEADTVKARFAAAWTRADVTLTSSRL